MAHQCASSQLAPTPASTTSGTRSSAAPAIRRAHRRRSVVHEIRRRPRTPVRRAPAGSSARARRARRASASTVDHRALDDVGRRALHRRVDRRALGAGAQALVARVDVRPGTGGGRTRSRRSRCSRACWRVSLHVVAHARDSARSRARCSPAPRRGSMPRLLRQAERAHAVDQAEVDRLGVAALLAADLVQRHAEHLGRGRAVHVVAVGERAQQRRRPRDRCAMIRSSICE